MQKLSYPQLYETAGEEPVNLKKWQKTKAYIDDALLKWPKYSIDQVVDLVTKEWDKEEKKKFTDWLDFYIKEDDKKYDIKVSNMQQELSKQAFSPYTEPFVALKEKFRSRIDSAKRILNQMNKQNLVDKDELNELLGLLQQLEIKVFDLELTSPRIVQQYFQSTRDALWVRGAIKVAKCLDEPIELCAQHEQFIKTGEVNNVLTIQQSTELLKEALEVLRSRKVVINLFKAAEVLTSNNLDAEDLWRAIDRLLSAINSASSTVAEQVSFVDKMVREHAKEQ